MSNAEQQKWIDSIKQNMKRHCLTSYKVSVFETHIGHINVLPKMWECLFIPIKGFHRRNFDVTRIMHLQGELYFIVEDELQTYDLPYKRKRYRLTYEELIQLEETTPWSRLMFTYGGKKHHNWRVQLLKTIATGLKYYDPIEEAKWRNQPQLTATDFDVFVKVHDAQTSWLEKLVNKIYGY